MSVFNRDEEGAGGARAVIVIPVIDGQPQVRSAEARGEEAAGLAAAIGIEVADIAVFRVRVLKPSTLIGGGQVEELARMGEDSEAELVIVDAGMTPVQQKTMEERTGRKVIDRTGLILEIFGERAATAEGRLQVELAHLDYQAGRLVRTWTHLERQRGGFGFLGGPGETQIEADRRQIRDRMAKIRKELEQVKKTRALHRERRQRAPWPVVALVGYTNAGKSTLFNRLARADVMAKDLLFATLDPTMRQIRVPGHDKVILSDTVGFVSDLPTQLVAAFRATLEEVASADLILHVRDIAHEDSEAQRTDVEDVLKDLGLDGEGAPPRLEVWNKLDLLHGDERRAVLNEAERRDDVITVSALSGEGMDGLREKIGQWLDPETHVHELELPASDGERIAWLYQHGKVMAAQAHGDMMHIEVELTPDNWARFQSR